MRQKLAEVTHVAHSTEQFTQELLVLYNPAGHSIKQLLGAKNIYPERQVVQLVAVFEQVRQGCRHE